MNVQNVIPFTSRYRLLILPSVDVVVLFFSLFLSQSLTGEISRVWLLVYFWIILSTGFVCTAWALGLYRASTRHAGIHVLKKLLLVVLVVVLFTSLLALLLDMSATPSFFVLLYMFSVGGSGGARLWAREQLFAQQQYNAKATLVYGSGAAGLEFLSSSLQGNTFNVVGLVDEDKRLVGSNFHGCNVYSVAEIPELIELHDIKIVVLALPSLAAGSRSKILTNLSDHRVRILTVPPLEMLISGQAKVSDAQDIPIGDLLGREPMNPIPELIAGPVAGKVVLISGAGGSIGSELARQAAQYRPKKLVLFDSSEPALFSIEQELAGNYEVEIISVLGSVIDYRVVDAIFREHSVDTVFHAAAYKHVPLVEDNPFVALINNVTGTKNVLNCAVAHETATFTLISTDKAVRPTNIMGATKRLAELICQAEAEDEGKTKISMVRFGNVLGSSGSVIPTFKKQIEMGGPVTVTHPEMTRFFMTIPEAAQLVMQASEMAEGGDVFLLNMGDSIKISYLAERLIRMSGRILARPGDPQADGEIRVEFTGLRPGEKLYEELLIDATSQATSHPRIMKARELFMEKKELESLLSDIYHTVELRNVDNLKETLKTAGIGYHIDSHLLSDLNVSDT